MGAKVVQTKRKTKLFLDFRLFYATFACYYDKIFDIDTDLSMVNRYL